jgi:hypothetical protein
LSDQNPFPIDPNADFLEVCKRLADENKKTESNDEDDEGLPLAS